MAAGDSELVSGADWPAVLEAVRGRTVLVVGTPGTGKSRLARYLAEQPARDGAATGLVSTDMGQPSVGVPTCLGLALAPVLDSAATLWFIGETTPRGHLLPSVVGTARLAARARAAGAQTVVIDTSGYLDGLAARLLKYHKLLAAEADLVIAIQKRRELEPLLRVLEGLCPDIRRVEPVVEARDRTAAQRRTYRETLYRQHFQGGRVVEFRLEQVIDADWLQPRQPEALQAAAGTVAGLLDERGFCLGLGLLEQVAKAVGVYTAVAEARRAIRLQIGRMRLDRRAGFAEVG